MDVLDALSGNRLSIGVDYESLSSLHHAIEAISGVPAQHQLLLIPSGNRLKLETVSPGQQVFLYNKQIISGDIKAKEEGPDFAPIDQLPPDDFDVKAQWAQNCQECTKQVTGWVQTTRQQIAVILKAATLAQTHMRLHMQQLDKSAHKKRQLYDHVKGDLKTCSTWQHDWDLFEKIRGLGDSIAVLDKEATTSAWDNTQRLVAEIEEAFESLDINLDPEFASPPKKSAGDDEILLKDMIALTTKIHQDSVNIVRLSTDEYERMRVKVDKNHREILPEILQVYKEALQLASAVAEDKSASQAYLAKVVRQVSEIQTNSAKIKPKIADISENIRKLDEYKAQVAKVVDFPFIYGVSLIEISRRRSWSAAVEHLTKAALSHFDQLRENEYTRIDKWTAHYSSLNLIEKLVSIDVKLPSVKIEFEGIKFDKTPDISEYLEALESAGFHDVCQDLKAELGAMSHQLERSFRATSKIQMLFPDMNASQVIQEDRLRSKLRAQIEKELSSQVEAECRPRIEREVREKLEAEREEQRAQIERDARLQVESKVRAELRAEIEGQVKEQHKVDAEKLEKERKKNAEELDAALEKFKVAETNRQSAQSESSKRIEELEAKVAELSVRPEQPESQSSSKSKESVTGEAKEKSPAPKEVSEPVTTPTSNGISQSGKWLDSLKDKTHDLGQRLYANSYNLEIVLEKMGLQTTRKVEEGAVNYSIKRVRGLSRRSSARSKDQEVSGSSTLLTSSELVPPAPRIPDPSLLNWVFAPDNDDDFRRFIQEIYIDYDTFRHAVIERFGDVEKVARKYFNENKVNKERVRSLEQTARHRLSLGQFTTGDLILFLPTRDSDRTPNPWAAFNINSPHYFLNPENAAELANREFLIGRATSIVQHEVKRGNTEAQNPFHLPEGLRWYMITAAWK